MEKVQAPHAVEPLLSAVGVAESSLALVLGLQQQAMHAQDIAELGFVVANDTWQLLTYDHGVVFLNNSLGNPVLKTVSGLATLQEETPFTLWLGRLCRLASADFPQTARILTAANVDADLGDAWHEWWPASAVLVPLRGPSGRSLGYAMFARNADWQDADLALLDLLAGTWAYCIESIQARQSRWLAITAAFRTRSRWRWWALAALGVLLLPVRLSALAPAEIIALQSEVVAAPMDGVIRIFHVPPNSAVKRDQALFSLDDTTLRNRRQVAQQALGVTRADALAAQQKSFDSIQSKSELATTIGRVREKEAELAYLEEALARVEVKAPLDGVFIYGDPNDWLGKPVVTGERVAQLAQPQPLGVTVWLPVGDAINLEPGAAIRIFLQTSPLSAIAAEIEQTSYQATLSPDGISSYRIRGRLAADEAARIGLRGVAKVYGSWRPLGYWFLRRPLGALRQWAGL